LSHPHSHPPRLPGFAPLPVRSPPAAIDTNESSPLQLYFPASRRTMTYTWRYLRRPIADGPATLLDVEATVEQAARQGFYLAPAYRRREVNHAHLLLLIDQEGSMIPFHRFTRDLVETAQDRQSSTIQQTDVYYFHNVPVETVYHDAHLTRPIALERVLAACDRDTSVLIVSDAGAARGYRRMERVRATTEFLVQLKQRTPLISWLNPMPVERWESTSAEIIAYLVRMYPMDTVGLRQAIDFARGRALSHLHNGLS
ncbi:MAG: VWA containing CoxE family protein, partial [Leptolyngbyaceae cyanobacterium RU_5_1]|nr:VWA containing CoxE family protein [Leptolyngbyaceae cyanobacterium RU_5_1]